MALLGNGSRNGTNPLRFTAPTTTIALNTNMGVASGLWRKDGANRNFWAGQSEINSLSAFPAGARHPVSWLMAPTAGGLASRNVTSITLSETGFAVLGLPGSGSATVTFSGTGTGGLIVSGSGSATITLSPTATILSVASGSGSATVTLTGSANIGAIAGMTGTSTITLSPTATSYAIGYLSGLSTNETEFSEAALARAVWTAVAIDNNAVGSMGAKVNAAGAAADPWAVALPGAYADGTAGRIIGSKLLTWARFLLFK